MLRIPSILEKLLPKRYQTRRFLLESYHFDLTSFRGDAANWLEKFPISESNSEMYFALAELFRRRGEFDKAVSVHQAIADAKLESESPSQIELEIAQDYFAAGLLGHAEKVLINVLQDADDHVSRQAFRLWLTILESHQDWQGAVKLVEQYSVAGSGGLRLVNLYCEYAKALLESGDSSGAKKTLRKASRLHRGGRSELMQAELATEQNRIVEAIGFYKGLLEREPKRSEMIMAPLKQLSFMYSSGAQLLDFLSQLYSRHPSIRIFEVILDVFEREGGGLPEEWLPILEKQMQTGLSYRVIEHWMVANHFNKAQIEQLKPALRQSSLVDHDHYRCTLCGFKSDQMTWLCPQCKSWETIYSDYELKIEVEAKKTS